MSSPIQGPNDPPAAFTVVYDDGTGEVVTRGFGLDQAIEVRKSMIDEAVRHAAVVELERFGYTVTKPGAPLTNYEYQMLDLIRGLLARILSVPVDEVSELEIDDLLTEARETLQEES